MSSKYPDFLISLGRQGDHHTRRALLYRNDRNECLRGRRLRGSGWVCVRGGASARPLPLRLGRANELSPAESQDIDDDPCRDGFIRSRLPGSSSLSRDAGGVRHRRGEWLGLCCGGTTLRLLCPHLRMNELTPSSVPSPPIKTVKPDGGQQKFVRSQQHSHPLSLDTKHNNPAFQDHTGNGTSHYVVMG